LRIGEVLRKTVLLKIVVVWKFIKLVMVARFHLGGQGITFLFAMEISRPFHE
jgi:hypothetical protein